MNRLLRIIYRIVWDFPMNWEKYGWTAEEMTHAYWTGISHKDIKETTKSKV